MGREYRLLGWEQNRLETARRGVQIRTVRVFNSRNSKPRNVRLSERGVKMLKTHGPDKTGLVFTS